MKQFKGIIVGAGRAGEILNLQPLQAQGAEIVAVCDPNLELAKKVAERNNVPNAFKTLEEAVKKVKADFAVIATPQQTHYQVTKVALKNKLHVLCEKPYTETLEQAKELDAMAAKAKRKVVIVHNFKFLPGLQEAAKIYDSGRIGQALHITRSWMVSGYTDRMISNKDFWAHTLVGGKWAEVLPHALYSIMLFVPGADLKLVSVNTMPPDKNWKWLSCDQASIVLKTPQTYITIFLTARVDKNIKRINDIAIWGSKGVIFANYAGARLVEGNSELGKLVHSAKLTKRFGVSMAKSAMGMKLKPGMTTGHAQLSEQFLAFLAGKGKTPVSHTEAYHTMRLTEEVAEAIKKASA